MGGVRRRPNQTLLRGRSAFIWEAVNMLDHHRVVGTDVVELPWPLSSHSQHGGEPVRVSLNFERARACTARLVWETVFEEVGAEQGGGGHGGPETIVGSADAVPPSYRRTGLAEDCATQEWKPYAIGFGSPQCVRDFFLRRFRCRDYPK